MSVKLSIVIPTLNEAPRIAIAVERAWALAAAEIAVADVIVAEVIVAEVIVAEVIVADGGSHDGTALIAAEHGATVVVCPPGRGQQLNLGAQHATGDVLLFLHADTWLAAAGAEQIAASLGNPNVVAGAFRQRIESAHWRYRWLEWGNALRARRWGVPYGDQGIFVRRATFDSLGGFPDVPIMEDLMFMRRLRRLARPALLDGPLHVSPRRWEHNGVVRQTLRNWSLLAALRLGVSPQRLANWYRPHEAT
jgi:rSAM/selenodomain-associated transferase 2